MNIDQVEKHFGEWVKENPGSIDESCRIKSWQKFLENHNFDE